jgi:hypothetical protein
MGYFFQFGVKIINELLLFLQLQKAIKNVKKKKRVKVALSTANPPHIHITNSFPI